MNHFFRMEQKKQGCRIGLLKRKGEIESTTRFQALRICSHQTWELRYEKISEFNFFKEFISDFSSSWESSCSGNDHKIRPIITESSSYKKWARNGSKKSVRRRIFFSSRTPSNFPRNRFESYPGKFQNIVWMKIRRIFVLIKFEIP